jgi:3-hydroxybutyryl-CoA dehydrogenase
MACLVAAYGPPYGVVMIPAIELKKTGAPLGPFAILDVVGINTAYNISLTKAKATGDPEVEKLANLLKTEYIDKGKIGREAGEGFYKYPNPNFAKPDFLRG